jgi:hypothetical protein
MQKLQYIYMNMNNQLERALREILISRQPDQTKFAELGVNDSVSMLLNA